MGKVKRFEAHIDEIRIHNKGILLVVKTCPYCGRQHAHGGGGGAGSDWKAMLGQRAAPCADLRYSLVTDAGTRTVDRRIYVKAD